MSGTSANDNEVCCPNSLEEVRAGLADWMWSMRTWSSVGLSHRGIWR